MSTSHVICQRTGRYTALRATGWALLALTFGVGEGRAQYRIDQGGRLFDANPQLGGTGYNSYIRPISPLVGGNPFATGNVGRGFSLRSFSPISASNALHATLGTTTLSNFIRDSVSVADQGLPLGGLAPRPFFDPVRTAPTSSYLRGFYSSQPVYPTQVPTGQETAAGMTPFAGALQYGSPPARRAEPGLSGRSPFESLGVPLNTELSSTIFGLEPPRLPGLLSDAALQPRPTYSPQVEPEDLGSDRSQVSARGVSEPLDLRVWPEEPAESLPTPVDVLMQENAARLLVEPTPPTLPRPDDAADTRDASLRPEDAATAGPTLGGPPGRDAGGLLGYDVFADMRLALELSLNPEAEWYTEMVDATRQGLTESLAESPIESPALAVEMQSRAAAAAENFLTRMLNTPLQTFVGEGASATNEELGQAEAAMARGRYYDAVQHYDRVRRLDPDNPLALVGKGHALLAAGEYVSAALSLLSGLERFPELARFQVDLTALMGGGEIVDKRRADLMVQLERNEEPQLRFLLGYLEVHTGYRDLGLQNLKRAAREAKPGTLIRRYPDMIRSKRMLPGPRLSPGESPGSTTNESQPPGSATPAPGKEP